MSDMQACDGDPMRILRSSAQPCQALLVAGPCRRVVTELQEQVPQTLKELPKTVQDVTDKVLGGLAAGLQRGDGQAGASSRQDQASITALLDYLMNP